MSDLAAGLIFVAFTVLVCGVVTAGTMYFIEKSVNKRDQKLWEESQAEMVYFRDLCQERGYHELSCICCGEIVRIDKQFIQGGG